MNADSANSNEPPRRLVDWQVAEEVVGGDYELLLQVIDAFLQEAPQQMRALRSAVAARDAATVRRAAHTLKGSLRYFGVRCAFDLALQLEHAGQQNELQDASIAVERLDASLVLVLDELRSFHARGGRA